MEQLDQSGLRIFTTSASLKNIFGGENESPLLKSLQKKHLMYTDNKKPIDHAAYERNMCSVERYSDVTIIIKVY